MPGLAWLTTVPQFGCSDVYGNGIPSARILVYEGPYSLNESCPGVKAAEALG